MTGSTECPAIALPSLAGVAWLVARPTMAVMAALRAAGHEGRVVGGCVRNALMGLPVTDIDIATDAVPVEVVRICAAAGLETVPTGLAHGTVTVVVDRTPIEVTTLRRDLDTDGRHATVAYTADWAEDARPSSPAASASSATPTPAFARIICVSSGSFASSRPMRWATRTWRRSRPAPGASAGSRGFRPNACAPNS
jgi:hypothetical protein